MIDIIDKQIFYLKSELSNNNTDNNRILDLMNILKLFREIFITVFEDNNTCTCSAITRFILQYVNLQGEVNFIELLEEFIKRHELKQIDIAEGTNIHAVQISNFLNNKHSMQTNNLEKLFNFKK
ncbi:helix-turn-helix domain-containing protein [Plebeiibacterium sediminum]|uniref:Helix-turn-helix domain-containing protein n=1 Tax=Plebeiibacterium sediminum TaxID=2992112 RepID=A0AAE3SHH3_9BACT|nr:helix-turn-helix transcriptional regulator [Plebeiobacterium sediminum]MCW3789406.1 helix-turn-helix domain-containing protein [Plebeiobacterium sediminum]